jgi:HK97 family phage major capsid protein
MADTPGMLDLQGEDIDTIVKNYAMENFTMLQVCSIVSTSKKINTYYEETDSNITKTTTTAITGTSFEGVPEGANFPYVEHSWTEINVRVKKHGADNVITWEVATLSAIDVRARMLERIGQAIAHSVDTAIITELATTTNTTTAVATWDNATESLQQPLKDILKGLAAMQVRNWNAYKNVYIIMHPNNFMELMNNPVVRNAGDFKILDNGKRGTIAGATVIVNNASTENTVLMCIGQTAMTWYEAKPLTTNIIERPGIDFTIRAWQVGLPVLINNYAAYKITGC